MARYNKKANIVLSRNKSYHGASLGALSITGDWRIQGHATVKEWTVRIPEPEEDPDLSKTRKIILETGPENIAAFCLETITGGNGVIIPPKSWWKGIQSLCDEFGIYLILDEIVCGFGRTGKNFGFHHFNLRPDFVCMAKAITGGHIPFGALWVTGKIAEHFNSETFSFGLTNYGHPLGLAAAKKVLQILSREKTKKHLLSLEKIISSYAKDFKSLSNVNEVRLTGALCAIELKSKIDLFHTLIEKGIYVSQIGQNLILCPSYITTEKQLKSGIETLFNIIKEISHDENILKCQRGA